MTWPAALVSTSNLDSASDSVALARADILAMAQAVNAMMSERLPAAQAGVPTGVGMAYHLATAPAGWVPAWGTIGNAGSAATNRANADCEALFLGLWTSMADAQAPVSGGRGASAAADWAALKTIALPDMRGRVPVARDDMGGTAAGRLQSVQTGTTAAGSAIVTGLTDTAPLTAGMMAFGANLPAGVKIQSVDSATQVTLTSSTGVSTGTAAVRFGPVDAQLLGGTGGALDNVLATASLPAHAALAVVNYIIKL